jgi:hypothetical protein
MSLKKRWRKSASSPEKSTSSRGSAHRPLDRDFPLR